MTLTHQNELDGIGAYIGIFRRNLAISQKPLETETKIYTSAMSPTTTHIMYFKVYMLRTLHDITSSERIYVFPAEQNYMLSISRK